MLVKNFNQLNNLVKSMPKKVVAIAVAENKELIELTKIIEKSGIAGCLLLGDRYRIRLLAKESDLEIKPGQIIHVDNEEQAAKKPFPW